MVGGCPNFIIAISAILTIITNLCDRITSCKQLPGSNNCQIFSPFFFPLQVQDYKLSIGAACGLSWPSDRLIVQVLDDSTNEVLRISLHLFQSNKI